jgi:uncharacterized membrane protein YfcA
LDALGGLAVAGAGVAAGTINAVVGSGSLITFPTLVGLGYSPLVANVSNTVGIFPGAFSAAYGYRRELAGQRERALVLGSASAAGGLTGGTLLLLYPATFETVVPWLVLLAVGLVLAQPKLSAALARRPSPNAQPHLLLRLAVALTGVYGGYFGAAQGVILIGVLGLGLGDHLQRVNALKNVLGGVVNLVAAALFVAVAPVAWAPAGIIAAGSIVGGQLGARVGRRLSPVVLRGIIAVGGVAVAIKLLV